MLEPISRTLAAVSLVIASSSSAASAKTIGYTFTATVAAFYFTPVEDHQGLQLALETDPDVNLDDYYYGKYVPQNVDWAKSSIRKYCEAGQVGEGSVTFAPSTYGDDYLTVRSTVGTSSSQCRFSDGIDSHHTRDMNRFSLGDSSIVYFLDLANQTLVWMSDGTATFTDDNFNGASSYGNEVHFSLSNIRAIEDPATEAGPALSAVPLPGAMFGFVSALALLRTMSRRKAADRP